MIASSPAKLAATAIAGSSAGRNRIPDKNDEWQPHELLHPMGRDHARVAAEMNLAKDFTGTASNFPDRQADVAEQSS